MQNGSKLSVHENVMKNDILRVLNSDGQAQDLTIVGGIDKIVYDPWVEKVYAVQLYRTSGAKLMEIKLTETGIEAVNIEDDPHAGVYIGAAGNGTLTFNSGNPSTTKAVIGGTTYPAEVGYPDLLFGKFGAKVKQIEGRIEWTVYKYKVQDGTVVVDTELSLMQAVEEKFPASKADSESYRPVSMVIGLDGEVYVDMEHRKGPITERLYFKLELAEEANPPKEQAPVQFDLAGYADKREAVINTALPVMKITPATKQTDYKEVANGARIDVLVEGSGAKRGTSVLFTLFNQNTKQFYTVVNLENDSIVERCMLSAVILPNGKGSVNINEQHGMDFTSVKEGESIEQTLDLQLGGNEKILQVNVAPDATISVIIQRSDAAPNYIKVITTNTDGHWQVENWTSPELDSKKLNAYRPISAHSGYMQGLGGTYFVTKDEANATAAIKLTKMELPFLAMIIDSVYIGNGKLVVRDGDSKDNFVYVLDGNKVEKVALPVGAMQQGEVINSLGADLDTDPPALLVDLRKDNAHRVIRIEFAEAEPEPVKFDLAAHAAHSGRSLDTQKPEMKVSQGAVNTDYLNISDDD